MNEPPPQVSPDGRFYWDGQNWVPLSAQPSAVPANHRRGSEEDDASGSSSTLGWIGVIASIIGLLLGINLMSVPMLLVGSADIALPLALGAGGIVLARKGARIHRWLSWPAGGVALLLSVFAVIAVATN